MTSTTIEVNYGRKGSGNHPTRTAECLVCEGEVDVRANHANHTGGLT